MENQSVCCARTLLLFRELTVGAFGDWVDAACPNQSNDFKLWQPLNSCDVDDLTVQVHRAEIFMKLTHTTRIETSYDLYFILSIARTNIPG